MLQFKSPESKDFKVAVSLGFVLVTQMMVGLPAVGQSLVSHEDIIVIGETSGEHAFFRDYWQRLLQLNSSALLEQSRPDNPSVIDGLEDYEREAKLKDKLVVTNLDFKTILRLPGSSQVIGTLKNENSEPVTVTSISFEILDEDGQLVRTGAAPPQPSTIYPGQSVTFSTNFFGLTRRPSYEVRLLDTFISSAVQ